MSPVPLRERHLLQNSVLFGMVSLREMSFYCSFCFWIHKATSADFANALFEASLYRIFADGVRHYLQVFKLGIIRRITSRTENKTGGAHLLNKFLAVSINFLWRTKT